MWSDALVGSLLKLVAQLGWCEVWFVFFTSDIKILKTLTLALNVLLQL